MLELGEYSEKEHLGILELIKKEGFQNVILVGKEFEKANQNFAFKAFNTADEVCNFLKSDPIKNGTLLIKGSRGIQLEKVLQYLS